MKARILMGTLATAGVALGVGQMTATALPGEGGAAETLAGPDVIVGAIPDVSSYGSNNVNGVQVNAYAFGTTSCNIGSVNLRWWQNTPFHPVIPQNAYRIRNGRMEQIGIGWMKHGFCALQQNLCSTCQPGGIGCGSATSELGVGCSDPYSSGLNGSQSGLGPRYEVNASTGVFPATGSTAWPAIPTGQSTIGRRCQIKASDLDPAQNAGAVYLAEATYVHPDDAASGNDNNNASYRLFTVGTGAALPITLTGSTFQQKPAIYHWASVNTGVVIAALEAQDGRFVAGVNVINNGNGTWRYEYAVYNLNSDSSAAGFSVPVPANVTITNAGFKDVAYHSGEPYDGTDWAFTLANGRATWQCTQSFAQNPNANALRFATLYNFWFDASAAPAAGVATLTGFKSPWTGNLALRVPSNPCRPADLNCSGSVDGFDLGMLLSAWGPCGGAPCPADLDANGVVNGADLGFLMGDWG